MPSSDASKAKTRHKPKKRTPLPDILTKAGIALIALAVTIALATFWPVILEELGYTARQVLPVQTAQITPLDTDFGIVIPKLGANAKVIPDVDPYNSRAYQIALTKGVAHAKGTGKPGQPGNVFLFSHSSVNFYEATRYNSIFYLLTKMEAGDEVNLYYQGTKYTYTVVTKQIVPATSVQYLKAMQKDRQTVTLMTCWPPGTTYKRLIVVAEVKP
jgi:sortase A